MNSYTVEELYRLAQDGNTEALVKLGLCYKEGRGVGRDNGAAAKCFYSAAKAGNGSGQYQFALCCEEGCGVAKDTEAAAYWYGEAARNFYEAARLGNPQAQYGLANCYAEGHGVEQDPDAAVYWYQAAAQQDHADAQYNLGYCYLFGVGVEANELVALKWYQSAAAHGDPQMQHNLGLIYKNGYGSVSKNYGKAAEWFFKAARQGYSQSKAELALIYFRNPLAVKDVSVAERLMTEAAEDGVQEAQIYLMHYYFDRDPSKQDMRKAYTWAAKIAEETKDPTASVIIGTSCANGSMFEKDDALAYGWLSEVEEETELLSGEACYYLGKYYQEGIVAAKSYEKASYFYSLSQQKECRLADQGLESLRMELEKRTREKDAEQQEAVSAGDTRIFEPIRDNAEPAEDMQESSIAESASEELPDSPGEPEDSNEMRQEDSRAGEERQKTSFERLRMQIAKSRQHSMAVQRREAAPLLDDDDRMLIEAYADEEPEKGTAADKAVYSAVPDVSETDTYHRENTGTELYRTADTDEDEKTELQEDMIPEKAIESTDGAYTDDAAESDAYEYAEETVGSDEELYTNDASEFDKDIYPDESDEPEEDIYPDESDEPEEDMYPDESDELEEDMYPDDSDNLYDKNEETDDDDWEFPSGFSGKMHPVGTVVIPPRQKLSGLEEGRNFAEKRPPVSFDKVDSMEQDLVDYEGADELPDIDEEDEDDEWESSDDNFIAALLATGARVTNTTAATPKKRNPVPSEKEVVQEKAVPETGEPEAEEEKFAAARSDIYETEEEESAYDGQYYDEYGYEANRDCYSGVSDDPFESSVGEVYVKRTAYKPDEKQQPEEDLWEEELSEDRNPQDNFPEEKILEDEIWEDEAADEEISGGEDWDDETEAGDVSDDEESDDETEAGDVPDNEESDDKTEADEVLNNVESDGGGSKDETSGREALLDECSEDAISESEPCEDGTVRAVSADLSGPRELVIDESILGESREEDYPENSYDVYDEVSAASTEPISRRITGQIPINEVLVDDSDDDDDPELPSIADESPTEKPLFRGTVSETDPVLQPDCDLQPDAETIPEDEIQSEEAEMTADALENAVREEHEDNPAAADQATGEELDANEDEIPNEGQLSKADEEVEMENIGDVLQKAVDKLAADTIPEQQFCFGDREKKSLQEKMPSGDEIELTLPDDFDELLKPGWSEKENEEQKVENVEKVEWISKKSGGEDDEEEEEPSGRFRWVGIAFVVIAGALAVAAAILFATGRWPSQQTSVGQSESDPPSVHTDADSRDMLSETSEAETDSDTEAETKGGAKKNDAEETTQEKETDRQDSRMQSDMEETSSGEKKRNELFIESEGENEYSEADSEEHSQVNSTEEESLQGDSTEEQSEETPSGEDDSDAEETAENSEKEHIVGFSDEPYTEIEVPVSGCVYAKLCSYDEKGRIVYAGKPTEMEMPHVAEAAEGMNVIGSTVYYRVSEDSGSKAVYYVPESGGDPQPAAFHIPADTDCFIMNNSIFAGSREYVIGENPEGTEREGVRRFLTFSPDYVYYLTEEGTIGRSTYDWSVREEPDIPLDTEDTVWAQVIGRYLLIYLDTDEMLYSYDMETGTLVELPLDGLASCDGLAANGNWIYGILDGELVRVRPNGSGLETVLGQPEEGSWTQIVHATEHFVIAVMEGEDGSGEYLIDPETEACDFLAALKGN